MCPRYFHIKLLFLYLAVFVLFFSIRKCFFTLVVLMSRALGFFPPEIRQLTGIIVKSLLARTFILFLTGRKMVIFQA